MFKKEIVTPKSVIVVLSGAKIASHPFNFDIIVHTTDIQSVKKTLAFVIERLEYYVTFPGRVTEMDSEAPPTGTSST